MNPYFQDENITLYNCDVMEGLAQLPDESVQCVVTSPPYWGLRDYGIEGQLGLETAPEKYIEKMVRVFNEVKRVLKNDGVLWLNMGDSYAKNGMPGGHNGGNPHGKFHGHTPRKRDRVSTRVPKSCKPKDLIGIPWMLAFALRADGWYLRNDIIWAKPNSMPESVVDRCTRAHEYIFHLTKSEQYFYDADAIRVPFKDLARFNQDIENQAGSTRAAGGTKTNGNMKARGNPEIGANKRTVWNVPVGRFSDSHFAVFPIALIEPCILAGSRAKDTVLDPFWGSGTTGEVAIKHGRKTVGIELSADYCELSLKRFKQKTLNF